MGVMYRVYTVRGLSGLDLKHIRALTRRFKFWKSLYISSNTVLRTIFSC